MKSKLSFIFVFLTSLILFGSSFSLLAKELNIYEQPKSDSKVVGTIDLSQGIIPIYTPKGSEWVKVADPRNGNVGWIKSGDLSTTNQSTFTFTESYINNGKPKTTYRVIQMGEPKNLSQQEIDAIVKQTELRNQEMQKSMQQMMKNMNQWFQNDWPRAPYPMMPIVIIPVEKGTTPNPNPVKKPPQAKEIKTNNVVGVPNKTSN